MPVEQFDQVLRGHEIVHLRHPAARVDLHHALRHGLHLGAAIGIAQRVDLAVGVGYRDMVEIDQRDTADRIARERLGRPAAHPADADHANAGRLQPRQARRAIQARHATEAPVVVVILRALVGKGRRQLRQLRFRLGGSCGDEVAHFYARSWLNWRTLRGKSARCRTLSAKRRQGNGARNYTIPTAVVRPPHCLAESSRLPAPIRKPIPCPCAARLFSGVY